MAFRLAYARGMCIRPFDWRLTGTARPGPTPFGGCPDNLEGISRLIAGAMPVTLLVCGRA